MTRKADNGTFCHFEGAKRPRNPLKMDNGTGSGLFLFKGFLAYARNDKESPSLVQFYKLNLAFDILLQCLNFTLIVSAKNLISKKD